MITIIINPVSGGARPGVARARAELAASLLAASGEAGEVLVTERRGHARDLAAGASRRGARLVLSWGGDGTMNEVASAVLSTDTPIALVPAGSGNGLARELGVPFDPAHAIRQAMRASPRTIDAGELGGRPFFNIAGVGFDAQVAARFDGDAGVRRGPTAYARSTARELWQYRPASYRIDGGETEGRALLVTLANSPQYGIGARIAPAARVDDGRLDLVVFEERSRVATMFAVPRLFLGGLDRVRGVSTRQVTAAVIESEHPMLYHVDGEPVQGGTRLEARVLPGALRICV